MFPVPIYEFECEACGNRFDELVRGDEAPSCPVCGKGVRRVYSSFAPGPKHGLTGADARRTDAKRRAERERKQEQARKPDRN